MPPFKARPAGRAPPKTGGEMSDQLSRMLGERPWLLADGATGTNLYNMGLTHGQAPDLWTETQPDKVRELHIPRVEDRVVARAMGEAGADSAFGLNGLIGACSALGATWSGW